MARSHRSTFVNRVPLRHRTKLPLFRSFGANVDLPPAARLFRSGCSSSAEIFRQSGNSMTRCVRSSADLPHFVAQRDNSFERLDDCLPIVFLL